jgi:uncharacterized protein with von Willebrand factor type A (vWA) domain
VIDPEAVTDVAELSVAFAGLLQQAGVPVSPDRSSRFAQSIRLTSPATIDELYWLARITLVTQQEDIELFGRVFDQVFRGLGDVPAGPGPPAITTPPVRTRPAGSQSGLRRQVAPETVSGTARTGRREGPESDDGHDVTMGTSSRDERLATTDFGLLAPDELAELYALMRGLRLSPPLRPGRRARRHRSGDSLDLRATLRRSRRSGGDPVVAVRRQRPPRPRRMVVLCDISGSMEPYARAYLQFLHASVGARRAEVFVFATRLTRLTSALSLRRVDLALTRAAETAPDWRSGTRIAAAVKTFLDDHGRRGMARGAVVVIVSDGWEHDDPAHLAEQMRRLRRLAHRVVWVNPRTADDRYRPLAAGMAAALPSCDIVVSGHTAKALRQVIEAIRGE